MNAISLIETHAFSIPQKIALRFKRGHFWETLSWKEFWEEICRTANGLRQMGLQKGNTIGIFSQNSRDWIILDIASQAVGAIPVPIYATSSQEQAAFIINHGEISYLLAGDQLQYDILCRIREAQHKPLTIFVSQPQPAYDKQDYFFSEWNQQFSAVFKYEEADPEDIATIIYTSGTTGEPKGVMLTHKSNSAIIQAHKAFFNITNLHHTRSMAFLPLSHVFEREWTSFVLSQGGEIVVLEDPKNVLEALKEVKPTAMCAVPRFYEKVHQALVLKMNTAGRFKRKIFNEALKTGKKYADCLRLKKDVPAGLQLKQAFFNALVFKKIKKEFGGNLNFLPVGGAMLKKEISEFMAAVGMPVIVGYGLTETSATVSAYPVSNFVHGSVGRALPGVEIKIGTEDEILVKYEGLMKGYFKDPQETAQVFTPDGYFKTGDCGSMDAQGNLYITDRIKDLMKTSNGKYIAPQPIENALQLQPEISQAMIIADGRPYVTALIVPDYEALAAKFEEFRNFKTMSLAAKAGLLNTSQVLKAQFEKMLARLQQKDAAYEKIKKFYFLPEEFSIENGALTPTLKVKRKLVLKKMEQQIECLYDESLAFAEYGGF